LVNTRRVKIQFEVPKAGPSGLESVDLYVTTDEGATWETSPIEPDVTLPSPGEGKREGPIQGFVTLTLPSEGVIYGFYLVVKSRAGLGKPPPRPGDLPQVRIEADTTLPVAELYALAPDPAHSERLILTWKAEDRNLAPNPVSLEWSATPNGPWSFIGDPQLPNTGRYSWQVPAEIPWKVYFRLTVRDAAGNAAIAQTDQPQVIDPIVPKPPIIKGVRAVP
jgi:hypothetical protein